MPTPNRFRRDIKCEFFRVENGDATPLNLLTLLTQICVPTRSVAERNLPVDDGYLRLYGWACDETSGAGTLLRLRTDNMASVAGLTEDRLSLLTLDDGQVLAEYYCFKYFAEFSTLVIHRNRQAGSYKRLAHYVEKMSGLCPVNFDPILTSDAFQRLERMDSITRVELKIAMPKNLAVVEPQNSAVAGAIDMLDQTGAATLTMSLSMDHSKNTLRNSVKGIIKGLMGALGTDTKTARVRGRLPEHADTITEVDLITDCMREVIAMEQLERSASVEEIHAAIQSSLDEAYKKRRHEICWQFE